jgi:hypothetical protein
LGHDPLQTLIAQVRIDGDWLVRPLHNCASRTRCGYVEVTVSNEQGAVLLTEAAASLSINLPFAGLPVPDGSSLTFAARLMDQNGEPYVVADAGLCGREDTCSITLTLAQRCAGSAPQLDAGAGDASLMADAGAVPADASSGNVDASDTLLDAAALADGALDANLPDGGGPAVVTTDAGPDDASADAGDAADAG